MNAFELLASAYQGEGLTPPSPVIGIKPLKSCDMICDCDDDGECCGN